MVVADIRIIVCRIAQVAQVVKIVGCLTQVEQM